MSIEALEKSPLFTDQGMKGGMLFVIKIIILPLKQWAQSVSKMVCDKNLKTEYLKDKDVRSGGVALEDKLILDASGADLRHFLIRWG